MKTRILHTVVVYSILALTAVIAIPAVAQPVIDDSNFGHRKLAVYQLADSATIPVIETAQGTFWDFSTMKPAGPIRELKYETGGGHPVFPEANYSSSEEILLGSIPIVRNRYYDKNNIGLKTLGFEFDPQEIDMAPITGFAGDRIKVLTNKELYIFTVYMDLRFPMAMNTSWEMPVDAPEKALLSITSPELNFVDTPAEVSSVYRTNNKVISFGTCRVPQKYGAGASPTFPVLLVKSTVSRTDNFTIKGQTPTGTVRGHFGFTSSGAHFYTYRFFRADAGYQCMAIITFTDATFTKIAKAEYSAEFLGLGQEDNFIHGNAAVYPNPASSEGFNVVLPGEMACAGISLVDISGKQIPVSAENTGGGVITVKPSVQLAPGAYTVVAQTAEGTMATKLMVQ